MNALVSPTPGPRAGSPRPLITFRALGPALALIALAAGCAQPGPFGARQTMVGSLKTSVSHLESEKYELQKQVAELKSENRRLEDELVQSEANNGDLAARLDDARNLIRRQGYDTMGLSPPSTSDPGTGSARSTPASRPRGRRMPFAQIPGEIRPLPESSLEPDDPESNGFGEDSSLFPSGSRDPYGLQGRRSDLGARWLPVARGLGSTSGRVR